MKVPYYSTVTLRCQEDPAQPMGTGQVFWITPDNAVIQPSTPQSQLPANIVVPPGGHVSEINVTNVSDDSFGYYTCVMVTGSGEVMLARWGLNVDGADFSDLEEQYRRNAVIGAIAAAVMVVVVGGACLVWHFRYSRRGQLSGRGAEEDLKKPSPHLYDNGAFAGKSATDMEMAETTTVPVENGTGSGAGTEDEAGGKNGEVESIRM